MLISTIKVPTCRELYEQELDLVKGEIERLKKLKKLANIVVTSLMVAASVFLLYPALNSAAETLLKYGLLLTGAFFFYSINFINKANVLDLKRRASELVFILSVYAQFNQLDETEKAELVASCKEKIKKM